MMLSSDVLSFSREHEYDDIHKLALQANHYPDLDISAVIQQIQGLQKIRYKVPSWYNNLNIAYPKSLSLEQSSSEATAIYKVSICKSGKTMVDLTGGLGIDLSFFSTLFEEAVYVEQQEELTRFASHNFRSLGLNNIIVKNIDSFDYLNSVDHIDFVFIDPARRNIAGQKTVRIEDCTPNLIEIQEELYKKSFSVMMKLSPMLDISLALSQLRDIRDIHIISVDNECKELLFVWEKEKSERVKFHCVNIRKNEIDKFIFSPEDEENAITIFTSEVKSYLYEPNSSITKAGAFKSVADRFKLEKLHVSSHLYTSNSYIKKFPGRIFKVKSVSGLGKKEIKDILSKMDKANITTRNFPLKVEELRKKLRLNDGGDNYIFATTLHDDKRVLIISEKV